MALEKTVDVQIWFVCTIQRRRQLPDHPKRSVFLLNNQYSLVTIESVPQQELANGGPSATVIWQAESMFLERQEQFYPDHDVVAWEARYAEKDGPVLSRFEVRLPVHED